MATTDIARLLAGMNPAPLTVRSLSPNETSPGKGSRDLYAVDAMEWGKQNLGDYLAWGDDIYGVFDPQAVADYKASIANLGEDEPRPQFTNFTLPQLQAYLTRVTSAPVPTGDSWRDGLEQFRYDNLTKENDMMWMPKFVDYNGRPLVEWGERTPREGGFLDSFTENIFSPALALSGLAPLSTLVPGLGTALSTGLGELLGPGAAWGVNAAGGASGALAAELGAGLATGAELAGLGAGAAGGAGALAADAAAAAGATGGAAGAAGGGLTAAQAAGVTSAIPSLSSLVKSAPTLLKAANNALGIGSAIGSLTGAGASSDDAFDSIRQDEEARQARIKKSVEDIRGQFGKFDDNYLKGVSSSYLDYYLPQFNEQAKEARRQTVFNTPSAGTSAFARRAGQLETDIGRQEANIRSQAQAQAQAQKARLANQEETLVSQAEGAGGIADAGARAASAAELASVPEPFSPLGQLFATYTGNVANAAQAERLGYQPTGIVPNIFSRPGGRQPVQYVG